MTKHKKNKKPEKIPNLGFDRKVIISQEETVEAILKVMEDAESCDGGIRHHPTGTLKRNALFLIKSSEKIEEYASSALMAMKKAYKQCEYKKVIDLAYSHDKTKRPNNFIDSNSSPCNEIMSNLTDLLSEDIE